MTPPAAIGRGIVLRVVAASCFATMSALLKLASVRGVAAAELLFYRAFFGLPILFVWALLGAGLHTLGTKMPWVHVRRSLLGVASLLCTFQALTMLPLADATTIAFMMPVFATILSFVLLRERVGVYRWGAVLCGLAGVAIIMQPGGSGHVLPLAGLLFGLVAALGSAGVTIAVRQMRGEHVSAIVFWFFMATLLAGAAFLPLVGSWHDPFTFLLLAAGGIAGTVAQIAMTASLRHAPVSVVMPFDYLQMLGAIAFGWLLFEQWPDWRTWLGAALIAGSGLFTAWREHVLRRQRGLPAA